MVSSVDKDLLNDVEMFHNLGHATRLQILEYLLEGEKTVSELLELISGLKQGRLSNHLG
ncbi:MAG: ArsR family transcriptional regulator [Chloroflexota bacterium]